MVLTGREGFSGVERVRLFESSSGKCCQSTSSRVWPRAAPMTGRRGCDDVLIVLDMMW